MGRRGQLAGVILLIVACVLVAVGLLLAGITPGTPAGP